MRRRVSPTSSRPISIQVKARWGTPPAPPPSRAKSPKRNSPLRYKPANHSPARPLTAGSLASTDTEADIDREEERSILPDEVQYRAWSDHLVLYLRALALFLKLKSVFFSSLTLWYIFKKEPDPFNQNLISQTQVLLRHIDGIQRIIRKLQRDDVDINEKREELHVTEVRHMCALRSKRTCSVLSMLILTL